MAHEVVLGGGRRWWCPRALAGWGMQQLGFRPAAGDERGTPKNSSH